MPLNRISVVFAPIVILILLATSLIGIDRLAFRDVGHFYTPLYDYVASRTSDQWLPLWNPLDATGVPLLGETSTAVLYPPRYLIFALPVSTDVAMAWYVALHLILASLSARYASILAGVSRSASNIAGIVYPLSGSVLFLYTNPPFLVGAAWLPFAVGVLSTNKRLTLSRRCLIAGPVLAMMVLGGDPQTALHAVLVATGFWIVRLWRPGDSKPIKTGFCSVLLSCALAAGLAAPQLAASIAWSARSDRVASGADTDWVSPPDAGGRRYESFQFSFPPWHVAETVTPNAFGSLFPINRRISALIPGDGRMWTPTIYLGLLTGLALLSRIGSTRRLGCEPWLIVAGISLLLSFGHFGPVWLIQQVPGALQGIDSAAGGPYWLLYHCLPGYDAFRYPCKWLPVFSLAASIVAAKWTDDVVRRREKSPAWMLALLGVFVLAIAVVALTRNGTFDTIFTARSVPADRFWGPLDIPGSLGEINLSLLQSLVSLLAIAITSVVAQRQRWQRETITTAFVMILAFDLFLHAKNLIATVNRDQEQALIGAVSEAKDHGRPNRFTDRWMRTQSGGGWPKVWRQTSDANRLTDVETSERLAWFGRWQLSDRQNILNNMLSIRSREDAMFWKAAGIVIADLDSVQRDSFWRIVREWLRVNGVIHLSDDSRNAAVDHRTAQLVDGFKRVEREQPSEFRFYDQWRIEPKKPSVDALAAFLRKLNQTDNRLSAIVHTIDPVMIKPADLEGPGASITVLDRNPEFVRARITNAKPGVLTRPTIQDGSWIAEYRRPDDETWQPKAVHQVNFLTQGIVLPPGAWEVHFRYAPPWLTWTLAVSVIGWCLWLAMLWRHVHG